MSAVMTADVHSWEPRALGLPKATLLAMCLVTAIIAFCLWATTALGPKPVAQAIQVTQATLTQLPRPTPPPPPKVVPPPKPLPAVIPKPPPVQSKIVVATKPPPVHLYKPVPHPVINHAPPPPTPAPVSQAPQPPAAPPTSGIPVYGNQMYNIIQANQDVPQALAQLGVSGTAVVDVQVAPDGHVLAARILQSSGVTLIDQTALEHAENAAFPPFNAQMPQAPQWFKVPVEIQPQPE